MNQYRLSAEQAHAAGFTYFDQLGHREVDGGLEIWLRVVNPATFAVQLLKTQLATADGLASVADLESVADLWGGAAWAEQEFRRAAASLTSSGGFAHSEGSQ